MSIETVTWALKLAMRPSTMKFVLVAMANCADLESRECYPSVKYLSDATCQDRKTVLANIKRLVELGYLEDTGDREGITKQVIVYRINDPENGFVEQTRKRARSKPSNSPQNGIVKQARNRNSSENGTVPVFPVEESRFSVETVPKTGHGTVKEPSLEPSGRKEESAPASLPPPPNPSVDPRGSRLSPDVELSLTWQNEAIRIRPDWGPTEVERIFSMFKDFWLAKTGKEARKADWSAAWRFWCRSQHDRRPGPGAPLSQQESVERTNARVLAQAKAERERKKKNGTLEYGLMTEAERAEQAFAAAGGNQPFPDYP